MKIYFKLNIINKEIIKTEVKEIVHSYFYTLASNRGNINVLERCKIKNKITLDLQSFKNLIFERIFYSWGNEQ